MSFYNVGLIIGNKYYNQQGEGVSFVKILNEICKKCGDGHTYSLSIDASTTCTGFCLMRDDELVHVVFDYARKQTEKEIFFCELESILTHLVWGLNIKIVLIEQPILQARNRHTKNVLLALCKRLKSCMRNIPELYNIKPIDVRPNSWKSFMFDSERYKGGYNDKATIARCICDKYPVYEVHYNKVTSKDFDCFDAVGILRYYLDSLQNTLGECVNFSSVEYTHFSTVWVCYGSNPKPHFELQQDANVVIKKWNDEYNYYKNIKMASSEKDIVVMEVKDDFIKVLVSIEAGVRVQRDESLYIVVHRESIFKNHKTFINRMEGYGYSHYSVY